MTDIICTDPAHDSRFGEDGWAAVLGTTDLPESPPGVLCAACAAHVPPPVEMPPEPDQETRIADLEAKLDAALALIAGE